MTIMLKLPSGKIKSIDDPDMAIIYLCPECKKPMAIPHPWITEAVRCISCKKKFIPCQGAEFVANLRIERNRALLGYKNATLERIKTIFAEVT